MSEGRVVISFKPPTGVVELAEAQQLNLLRNAVMENKIQVVRRILASYDFASHFCDITPILWAAIESHDNDNLV